MKLKKMHSYSLPLPWASVEQSNQCLRYLDYKGFMSWWSRWASCPYQAVFVMCILLTALFVCTSACAETTYTFSYQDCEITLPGDVWKPVYEDDGSISALQRDDKNIVILGIIDNIAVDSQQTFIDDWIHSYDEAIIQGVIDQFSVKQITLLNTDTVLIQFRLPNQGYVYDIPLLINNHGYEFRYATITDKEYENDKNEAIRLASNIQVFSQQEERAGLRVRRTISPSAAYSGQTIKVTYELTNTSTGPISNIQVREKLSRTPKTLKNLASGATTTVDFTAKMGNTDLTSGAKITFRPAGSTTVESIVFRDQIISLAREETNAQSSSEITATPSSTPTAVPHPTATPTPTPIPSYKCGDYTYTLLADGTAEIKSWRGESSALTIPDSLDGYTVTSIARNAFLYISLEKIVLPKSIKHIACSAFSSCSLLSSVMLPDTAVTIDGNPFIRCDNIKTIGISEKHPTLELINSILFSKNNHSLIYYPSWLGSDYYSIPEGTIAIGDYAFYGCTNVKTIILPASVKVIGNYAFSGCKGLTGLKLPEGLVVIEDSAFSSCSNLASVYLPSSLQIVGSNPFADCTSLKSINISADNRYFGSDNGILFSKSDMKLICYLSGRAETEYAIPNNIRIIGSHAFYQNKNLVRILFPTGLIQIDDYAFSGCKKLILNTFPDSLTTLGNNCFSSCDSLQEIHFAAATTTIGDGAFSWCRELNSVILPRGLSKINDSTFSYCSKLSKVTWPDSLTTIGDSAFSGCESLSAVRLPHSVVSIGDSAFSSCSKLANIVFPVKLESIGARAFSGCKVLESLRLPENLKSIGSRAFSACELLKSVQLPDGLKSIDSEAFASCIALEKISLPSSLITIGTNPFRSCNSLESIIIPSASDKFKTIDGVLFSIANEPMLITYPSAKNGFIYNVPDGISVIGESAFENCQSLKEVLLPDSLTTISDLSFANCQDLSAINLPVNLVSIGDSAFSKCSCLTSVIIPDSVIEMGNSAFDSCSSLSQLKLSQNIEIIKSSAFSGCSSLTSIVLPTKTKTVEDYAFSNCSSLQYAIIPASLSSIGDNTFFKCINLTYFEIPASTTRIGINPFAGCSKLSVIDVAKGNTSVRSIDGVLYSSDMQTLICYPCGKTDSVYIVPEGTKTIAQYAFYQCENLKTIDMPRTIRKIGYCAFLDCKSLNELELPNDIEDIGFSAFRGCESISVLTIPPNNAVSFASGLFSGLKNLKTVHIAPGIQIIPDGMFYGCTNITNITIPDGVQSIGESAFSQCKSLQDLTLPATVTSIGKGAFADCSSLKTIAIPHGITTIEESTFYNCNSLSSITLPDSVISINSRAFDECSSLESITLPDSIRYIGEWAFSDCNSLSSIIIPGSISVIDHAAFWECKKLAEVFIQDGVSTIGKAAFCGCPKLTHVSIPSSVKEIGDIAFYDCSSYISISTPYGSYAERYARGEFYLSYDNNYRQIEISYPAQQPDYLNAQYANGYYYNIQENESIRIVKYIGFDEVVRIPNEISGMTVTAIGDGAFDSNERIRSVSIPDCVVTVGKNPFSACKQLGNIQVSPNHSTLAVIDGVLFRKSDKCLICYPLAIEESSYAIPQGIKQIGDYAFYGCTKLSSISIPMSVINVGNCAFKRCTGLKRITLPQSIVDIGTSAFANCSLNLMITVEPDSCAAEYCLKNQLQFTYPNANDWLND